MKEDGEKPPADKDLTKAFQLADVDNSGTVDWDEFTQLYAKVKLGEVTDLRRLGQAFLFLVD